MVTDSTGDLILRNALLARVPAASSLNVAVEIEMQTRAVLALIASADAKSGSPWNPDPSACPNCGRPCPDLRSPYCSTHCREVAAFVRQMRSALQGTAIDDPERQADLGQKLWHLLGGGYPRRMPLIPSRVVRQVIAREGGRCQQCAAPAVTVDHPGSG